MRHFVKLILLFVCLFARAETIGPVYHATAPLTLSTQNFFGIPKATGSVNGYLASTDFANFNSSANSTLSNLASPTAVNQDLNIPNNQLVLGAGGNAAFFSDTGIDANLPFEINAAVITFGTQISDLSENQSIDTNARTLTAADANVMFDFQNGVAWDDASGGGSNLKSIDFKNRIAYDNQQNQVMNYTNGYLYDGPGGHLSLLWIDRSLNDSNNQQPADWNAGFTLKQMGFKRNVISSSSNFVIAPHISWVILNYSTSSQTITMPVSPDDGQAILITCNGGTCVTTLTLSPSAGQTIQGTHPTTMTGDTPLRYVWDAGIAAWMKW